jgi:hypothetical protein
MPLEQEHVRQQESHEEELQVTVEHRWKDTHRFEHQPLEDRGENRPDHERPTLGGALDREHEREQRDEQVELGDLNLERPPRRQNRVGLSQRLGAGLIYVAHMGANGIAKGRSSVLRRRGRPSRHGR